MHNNSAQIIEIDPASPVGVAEISVLLGVSANTVTSWRQRGQLPKPRWELKSGPIWIAREIQLWYRHHQDKTSPMDGAPDQLASATDLTADPGRAELFAHVGLAMMEAQMLEENLVAVLALLKVPEPYQRTIFLEVIESGKSQTLGQLARDLRETGAPVIGDELLADAVDKRNFLVHHFFRDPVRSLKMGIVVGRIEMIGELDEMARIFHRAVQFLRAAEVRLAVDHGVSTHDVMHRVRQLQQQFVRE